DEAQIVIDKGHLFLLGHEYVHKSDYINTTIFLALDFLLKEEPE
ncbi:10488_t:CDS:1, partial [Scutellospora calospora]